MELSDQESNDGDDVNEVSKINRIEAHLKNME